MRRHATMPAKKPTSQPLDWQQNGMDADGLWHSAPAQAGLGGARRLDGWDLHAFSAVECRGMSGPARLTRIAALSTTMTQRHWRHLAKVHQMSGSFLFPALAHMHHPWTPHMRRGPPNGAPASIHARQDSVQQISLHVQWHGKAGRRRPASLPAIPSSASAIWYRLLKYHAAHKRPLGPEHREHPS